jgi:hypothetical protein
MSRVRRFGALMPPLKAQIVDQINMAGPDGISAHALRGRLYDTPHAASTIRTHIAAINELLEETSVRIRCRGRSKQARWYLAREGEP